MDNNTGEIRKDIVQGTRMLYSGQKIQNEELQMDQDYHDWMRRRDNKSFHSKGIVEGFEVICRNEEKDPNKIIIQPGMAIDEEGNEIILKGQKEYTLKEQGQYSVFVSYSTTEDKNQKRKYDMLTISILRKETGSRSPE